jgi:hypothetical protein
MDDLVLVVKKTAPEGIVRTGRPARNAFALRKYPGNCIIAVPSAAINDGDRCDFYMSNSGFAVQFLPEGSRSVSKKQGGRTRMVSVPVEVSKLLADVPDGPHDLIADERPDRLWFFPFSQF